MQDQKQVETVVEEIESKASVIAELERAKVRQQIEAKRHNIKLDDDDPQLEVSALFALHIEAFTEKTININAKANLKTVQELTNLQKWTGAIREDFAEVHDDMLTFSDDAVEKLGNQLHEYYRTEGAKKDQKIAELKSKLNKERYSWWFVSGISFLAGLAMLIPVLFLMAPGML